MASAARLRPAQGCGVSTFTPQVSAFRATLEELQEANLILHVVDAASPLVLQHVSSVQSIVDDLQLSETSQILVLNKARLATPPLPRYTPHYLATRPSPRYTPLTLTLFHPGPGGPDGGGGQGGAAGLRGGLGAAHEGGRASDADVRSLHLGPLGQRPCSWWKRPSTLSDESAPSARLVAPRAQTAPTDPGAPPQQLGSSPWPQQPASGRPKGCGRCHVHPAGVEELLEMVELALLQTSVLPHGGWGGRPLA